MKKYLKIARFDHWIKQLFILPGVWLAWVMVGGNIYSILSVILSLLATSFAASANYVINEWLDAEFDKYHPVKKNRPAVTEGLSAKLVYLEYGCLLMAALAVACFINWPVFITIAVLLVMGVLYNV